MADKRIHDLTVTTSVTDAYNEWIGLDGSGDGSSTNSYKAINFSNFADAISADQNNANDDSAILTNKTIDADDNTISNIANSEIKTAAGIDASKIADGSVSNTEFQYLDGVTSNIQDQIDDAVSANNTYLYTLKFTASSTEASGGKEITANTILTALELPVLSQIKVPVVVQFWNEVSTDKYDIDTTNIAQQITLTGGLLELKQIIIPAAGLTVGTNYMVAVTFSIWGL